MKIVAGLSRRYFRGSQEIRTTPFYSIKLWLLLEMRFYSLISTSIGFGNTNSLLSVLGMNRHWCLIPDESQFFKEKTEEKKNTISHWTIRIPYKKFIIEQHHHYHQCRVTLIVGYATFVHYKYNHLKIFGGHNRNNNNRSTPTSIWKHI